LRLARFKQPLDNSAERRKRTRQLHPLSSGGFPPSYLVSKSSYGNFRLRVEFWSSDDANSGVLLRCLDAEKINDVSCYEVNIFDTRVDPTYATASIVGVAPSPVPLLRAGQKWNTYEITADGLHLVVVFNGIKTVDVEDTRLRRGPIALQWARGVVKFRSVQILER